MAKFAEGTTVDVAKTKADIENTLTKYGAAKFVSGYDDREAFVMFEVHSRFVRFRVPMPQLEEIPVRDGRNSKLTTEKRQQKQEQERKRRWRALFLGIKAKLELVETGIETFESAFAMQIVMPDGRTVADHVLPQIEEAYETGEVPNFFGGMKALGPGGTG